MDCVYERALFEVGSDGKFQKQFDVFFNFVFASLWAMAYNNIILALVILPHTCQIPQDSNNNDDPYLMSKFIPIVNDSSGKILYSSCLIYKNPEKSNLTKGCDTYSYNQTWYGSTVPSSYNWVCDDEIKVANIFAYSKIGEVVGSIIFGWFGDISGRRITYIISLGLLISGRIISIVTSNSYTIFVIGCVIAWFPSWSTVQSVTVISMEISAPKRRSLTATYRAIAYSTGMCLMPLLYWWLRDWRPFMIATTLTQLPYLIFSWKMLESPRWLFVKNKKEMCVKELQRIARTNNAKLKPETKQEILKTTIINEDHVLGPLSLFLGRNLAINTILQLYLWVAVSLSYMVLIMSSGEKANGNPFLEFAWQSIVEIPATFVGAWLADKIGRRYTGSVSYILSAIMWTLIASKETGMYVSICQNK
ncbi:unnamed protein product [Chilo suppressalis]|uniref:Major facilitator superfamily (MFS) profile domain-containing protein n=1 Tax=Chilo suppressalis TaxID=168631 RepID=A0ABN8LC94_CHISP|nr:unnamed protein product [Chilo suppressalis]